MNNRSWMWMAAAFTLMNLGPASGATLVAWDTNGLSGYGPTPWVATSLGTGVNLVEGLTRGSGITTVGTVPGSVWGGTGFTLGANSTEAIANNEFVTLKIQPAPGYELSLSAIDSVMRRSELGPDTYVWQYAIGGGPLVFANIGSPWTYSGFSTGDPNGAAQPQLDLSGISALQNVADTITLRLVLRNATNSTGTWGFGRLSGDDLVISGVAVPEPTGLMLGGLGLAVLAGVVRARRRAMV